MYTFANSSPESSLYVKVQKCTTVKFPLSQTMQKYAIGKTHQDVHSQKCALTNIS